MQQNSKGDMESSERPNDLLLNSHSPTIPIVSTKPKTP